MANPQDAPATSPSDSQPDQDASSDAPAKKAPRQTAIYPNVNASNKQQKPFSRSAAKRESVMALGSIEHLQHYFTKTGLSAKKKVPQKPGGQFVPAIGGGHMKSAPSLASIADIDLPPSPAVPANVRPPFPPIVKTYQIDPEILKPGVVKDLEAVSNAWGFGPANQRQQKQPELLSADDGPKEKASGDFDVLSVLKTTTRAIRSVRNYLVALPDDFLSPSAERSSFRHHSLSPPTAPRPLAPTSPSRDPLSLIRKSALEVLSALRDLEERTRIPLSDEAYDVQSDHGSSSGRSHTPGMDRGPSPSTIDDDTESIGSSLFRPVVKLKARPDVNVWSDEEDSFDAEEEEKKEGWDERLVLGGGWLYRLDVKLASLEKEREVVGRYLDTVDDVLFGGSDGERGWEREKRRPSFGIGINVSDESDRRGRGKRVVSTGLADSMREMVVNEEPEEVGDLGIESSQDESLPEWARRSAFVEDALGRAVALLVALLPIDLIALLPPPSESLNKTTLLQSLSSGQLLCVAYNSGVRRSKKPWGYINKSSIHDIAKMEKEAGEEKKTWTFRRTENLRLWAAALKLRYMLPLVTPPQPSAGNTHTPLASPVPPVVALPPVDSVLVFDAKIIAKREEGWEAMLEGALLQWMWAVVSEKREEEST